MISFSITIRSWLVTACLFGLLRMAAWKLEDRHRGPASPATNFGCTAFQNGLGHSWINNDISRNYFAPGYRQRPRDTSAYSELLRPPGLCAAEFSQRQDRDASASNQLLTPSSPCAAEFSQDESRTPRNLIFFHGRSSSSGSPSSSEISMVAKKFLLTGRSMSSPKYSSSESSSEPSPSETSMGFKNELPASETGELGGGVGRGIRDLHGLVGVMGTATVTRAGAMGTGIATRCAMGMGIGTRRAGPATRTI
ncbi:hypothetical protein K438DRAFT_1206815 [Mycena galopus ATCC 62051]|nr:hypothetical protein K438DRAFT_1206815 [Mycena galopus ATCC 62051]